MKRASLFFLMSGILMMPLAAADIFISNNSATWVSEYDSGGNVVSPIFIAGINQPSGVAFDHDGNLYVGSFSDNTVGLYDSGGGFIRSITNGISSPNGLAVDVNNNLWVANFGGNTVTEYDSSGGLVRTVTSGVTSPSTLAFDASGNLYVASALNNTVSKYDSSGNLLNGSYITSLNDPLGLAFDSSGHLFVGNEISDNVGEYDSSGGFIRTISGINSPVGLALDGSDNLYVANNGNRISQYDDNGNLLALNFATGLFNPHYIAFSVPEPSMGALFMLGVVSIFTRRRRRQALR